MATFNALCGEMVLYQLTVPPPIDTTVRAGDCVLISELMEQDRRKSNARENVFIVILRSFIPAVLVQ